MASRWQRRSLEEKQKIKDDVKRNRPEYREQRRKEFVQEMISGVYERNEIPIMCTCGNKLAFDLAWSHAKVTQKYTLQKKKTPFHKELVDHISAYCMRCGRYMERVIPAIMSSETVWFAMVLTILKSQDRLVDMR